jgi:hypothetical protein
MLTNCVRVPSLDDAGLTICELSLEAEAVKCSQPDQAITLALSIAKIGTPQPIDKP